MLVEVEEVLVEVDEVLVDMVVGFGTRQLQAELALAAPTHWVNGATPELTAVVKALQKLVAASGRATMARRQLFDVQPRLFR